ncbi:MAG: DUF4135 domain-containing protein [Cystobacter sp.]
MTRAAELVLSLSPREAGPEPVLPRPARRVVEAVRKGRGDAFFPPVARLGPEGALQAARTLQGEDDARMLALVLARPRFRPLLAFIGSLDDWCRSTARRYPGLLGPRVLSLTHAGLFGPLISEAFTGCALAGERPVEAALRPLLEGFQSAFELFLTRLSRDARAGVFRREGFETPVVELWSHPEETHNGRQGVLRLRFRKGGRVAYKPRPATGEAVFLAEGKGRTARSLFEWLNRLPPASGAVRLPTLRVMEGRGADRHAYSWQEWIDRPRQWGILRRAREWALEGCLLSPSEAVRFWHRAGSLSAACFAVGAADLFADNLLVGARRGAPGPMPYPVDMEVFFCPLEGLAETGLISDALERGNHHVGFERRARWCTAGGPLLCFFPTRGGGLQLRRRTRPWGRQEARSVVADTEGNVGYGAYLPAYLRGMFDAWTLMLLERARVGAFLRRVSRPRFVRVLLKDSATYGAELERRLEGGGGGARFSREEEAQLRRFDVPYFFQRARGGPLLYMARPPGASGWKRAGRQSASVSTFRPSARVMGGGRLTPLNLGVAVRDAVAFVFQDVRRRVAEEARLGVRMALRDAHRGSVSFDWPEVGQRLTCSWTRREVHVTLEPLW